MVTAYRDSRGGFAMHRATKFVAAIGAIAGLSVASALPASAASYSIAAVIETQMQGPLACGNTARGLEGTQTLLGISDEVGVPAVDVASDGVGGTRRYLARKGTVELTQVPSTAGTGQVLAAQLRDVELREVDANWVDLAGGDPPVWCLGALSMQAASARWPCAVWGDEGFVAGEKRCFSNRVMRCVAQPQGEPVVMRESTCTTACVTSVTNGVESARCQ